jgi:hypothetical protein
MSGSGYTVHLIREMRELTAQVSGVTIQIEAALGRGAREKVVSEADAVRSVL